MAPSTKKKTAASSQSIFAETLHTIASRFPRFQVFSDFLSMAMATCTRNPETGLSYYENDYLETIATYKDSDLRFEFPKAFTALVDEMESRVLDSLGNDVLGEFFEQHFANERTGQIFTPFHICRFVASISCGSEARERTRPLRILDPACGSGRMLLAAYREFGYGNEYYGIDIDRTCVHMTALNLFLNGIWNSEVLCANALLPDDFVFAYRISLRPLGIFKIEEKEQSRLWHLQKNSFSPKTPKHPSRKDITLDPTPFSERKRDDGIQLVLFQTSPP